MQTCGLQGRGLLEQILRQSALYLQISKTCDFPNPVNQVNWNSQFMPSLEAIKTLTCEELKTPASHQLQQVILQSFKSTRWLTSEQPPQLTFQLMTSQQNDRYSDCPNIELWSFGFDSLHDVVSLHLMKCVFSTSHSNTSVRVRIESKCKDFFSGHNKAGICRGGEFVGLRNLLIIRRLQIYFSGHEDYKGG
ncbi:hypothetical protein EGR_08585 [Echinococcus granulosus]|uniref:Uncharacterized protein n=1 Tax=Echinococcus granulosus TaxID=6210 RepID=W6UT45_ECHGR|nr:hypothetical protein EGR_08585 [Echinococcus granulosus]EUB56559.1 hypothetical protein EGR_08585 [Echinococcus granulosus]